MKCEGEFTYDGNPADVVRIGLQFGGKPNTVLWVDDFKFGKKKDQTPAAGSRRAGSITFEPKDRRREEPASHCRYGELGKGHGRASG